MIRYDPASLAILDRINHVVSLLETRPGTAGEARIVEDSDPNSCSPVIPQCVRSAVSVPGTYTDKTLQDANTGDRKSVTA